MLDALSKSKLFLTHKNTLVKTDRMKNLTMDTFRVLTRLIAAAVLMSGANALSITTQPPWFQGYWIENDLTSM
jgi:indole-3-glycerol phosphate synthase